MRAYSPAMKWMKPPVFVLCLAPFAVLIWRGLHDDLGGNPVQEATFVTGTWTLVFLCLTLAVTPLRKLTNQPWLIKFRRMLGLFAFFYGCLHFSIYWLDLYYGSKQVVEHPLSFARIYADILKRPFITAGFTAFSLMLPLALTSTRGMIRRLGGKRWQALHRLVYVSATAGVVHYYWQVKSDIRKPLLYAVIVAALLLYRLVIALRGKPANRPVTIPKSLETAEDG